MCPTESSLPCVAAHDSIAQLDGKASVDLFLVEALENPRYRLIVLRMELEIQKFMQNSDLCEFQFQQLPTSYLRCAAHRVAQHYGLETKLADTTTNKVFAIKTPASKYPPIFLSQIPCNNNNKHQESDESDKVKIVIRQRPTALSLGGTNGEEAKQGMVSKTIEQRAEEYDKARARIFNGSSSNFDDKEEKLCRATQLDERENGKTSPVEGLSLSRIAVFRDREKDRNDPDYDRSYKRYVRSSSAPAHNFPMIINSNNSNSNNISIQPQFFPFLESEACVNYGPPDLSVGPFSNSSPYVHWPMPVMMYTHCYVPQVPFYQSSENLRNG